MKFLFSLLTVFILLSPFEGFAQNIRVLYFHEKDADISEYLYRAQCIEKQSQWYCRLQSFQLSNEKSNMFKCTVVFYNLVDFTPAVYGRDTWTISQTKGACNYTNTYVFGPNGMVQTKTSPQVIPENMKTLCQFFPPKTYRMAVVDKTKRLPVGNCKDLGVVFP